MHIRATIGKPPFQKKKNKIAATHCESALCAALRYLGSLGPLDGTGPYQSLSPVPLAGWEWTQMTTSCPKCQDVNFILRLVLRWDG